MSARNMVRSLRDSGVLAAPQPAAPLRSTVLALAGALSLGAGVYLGAVYGLPAIAGMMETPPPVVSFARPAGD